MCRVLLYHSHTDCQSTTNITTMKAKSILGLFALLLGLGATTTSCEDMLTPDLNRYAENFNGKDTVNFYLGILANVQDVVEQNTLLGELRGDLADTTMFTSDSIADIANFKRSADGENALLNRSAYYKVINQCNFYLSKVDTLASKNSIYYMRKEAAQVMLIRAWTYMQLVQNYGRVPYITKPVHSANTGWEKNPEAWATPDNLLDLVKSDLEQALAYEKMYGLPNYGSFNTGAGNIQHANMLFHGDLVLGDLYLLRGASKSDFSKAAKYYYDYLKNAGALVSTSYRASVVKSRTGNTETYIPRSSSWANLYSESSNLSKRSITEIPSAANTAFGTTLTRIPSIYGFDIHSSNATTTNESSSSSSSSSTSTTTTSGQISLKANYKHRQIGPSQRFNALNKNLGYVFYEETADVITDVKHLDNGDARYYGTAPEVTTEAGRIRFIQKFGSSSSENPWPTSFAFRYVIDLYRTNQVYLRLAEALNRSGYPHLAFSILRGGLNGQRIPGLKADTVYNDTKHTKYITSVIDSTTVEHDMIGIDADELVRFHADADFADFNLSEPPFTKNIGINELGGGLYKEQDKQNTYFVLVAQRILDEANRMNNMSAGVRSHARKLLSTLAPTGPTQLDTLRWSYSEVAAPSVSEANPLEIDAVEDLISDECARELGFEGYRFADLCRFARHKNSDTSGSFPATHGTSWMAWQIARRSTNLKLYEQPNVYNATLYNTLMTQSNWYLRNPHE